MCSDRPKVLHQLAGRSLLEHVLSTVKQLKPASISVVYGHAGEQVRAAINDDQLIWVEQAQQLGTGHAVGLALSAVMADDDKVMIVTGDVPLLSINSLQDLALATEQLAVLSAKVADPTGLGRIVRDGSGQIVGIIEHKDANEEQLALNEINSGIICARAGLLRELVRALDTSNAQGEYYLTDIFAIAAKRNLPIKSCMAQYEWEVQGVNDRKQMAELERKYQLNQADELLQAGVALRDPSRIDIRGELSHGKDVDIDINCIFEGQVELGNGVEIAANCIIKNSRIGDRVKIAANTIIENADIGADCLLGPFARIRPDTHLENGVKVGNFVEIKKSHIASGSKVNHLSYIGDATLGQNVNIGAGTITCNYDGVNKHKTEIADDVFVGSNCELVAPIKIGSGATIGAGSTVTQNVNPNELAISRVKQKHLQSWKRPTKKNPPE